jgi:lysophospholipase L1-like esterase
MKIPRLKRFSKLLAFMAAAAWLGSGTAPAVTDFQDSNSLLTITVPSPYAVYQRSLSNSATLRVAGTSRHPVSLVEVKASLMAPYVEGRDGRSTGFMPIGAGSGSNFQGTVEIPAGGWYSLTIQAKNAQGTVIGQTTVDKVGVGEVFVAAGHSFCSNFQGDKPGKALDDRVATCADWSETPPEPLRFRHGDDPLRPGDADRASPWPAVGDCLVAQLHVPVLFICVGAGGTTVEQWRQSAEDPKLNQRGYPWLRTTLTRITPQTGLRAILWFGNENDLWRGPSATEFSRDLGAVIAQSRRDARNPRLPWIIAFDAYFPEVADKLGLAEKQKRKEFIDRGVQMVLETVENTFDGPQTDDLGPEFRRADGDHFNEAGVRQLGIRFARKISQAFFPPPPTAPMSPI